MEVSEVSTEAHGDGEACMTHLIFPNKLWPEIKNKSKKSSQCMKIYRKPEFSCGQCDYNILLCYILWSHVTNCVATLLRISLKTVHFKQCSAHDRTLCQMNVSYVLIGKSMSMLVILITFYCTCKAAQDSKLCQCWWTTLLPESRASWWWP